MIRAARNRSANVVSLSNAFGVEREECCRGARDAGFKNDGDARCLAAMNFHRTDVNRNISASVSVELACIACDEPHSFRESILAGIPIVIVLTDQAFPPILPAKNKKCVVVVRVEDGLLSEIENSFVGLFADFCAPTGRLPVGSVVLLGSMSHLGARGLDSYAGDIVGCMSSVGARVVVVVKMFIAFSYVLHLCLTLTIFITSTCILIYSIIVFTHPMFNFFWPPPHPLASVVGLSHRRNSSVPSKLTPPN
jgi:hypothetical protein